uniref:Receptor expression-enhancing protein n=1 Tax=Globodera pallida TaxID=36090 RepID=A0A183BR20_GLOPA
MTDEAAPTVAGGAAPRLQPRRVQVNSYRDVRPVLRQTLRQMEHPFIKKLEEGTGIDREKLFYIVSSFVMLYLLFGPGNALLCTLIGVVYPAYQSVLAVRTKTKKDDTQWLMYWCSFALFSVCDFFVTHSFGVPPLYVLVKTICLLYLALPQTCGAHNVYVGYVDPLVDWAAVRIKGATGSGSTERAPH